MVPACEVLASSHENGTDRRNADIRLTERGQTPLQAAEELLHQLPHTGAEAESILGRQLEHHIHELTQYEAHARFP